MRVLQYWKVITDVKIHRGKNQVSAIFRINFAKIELAILVSPPKVMSKKTMGLDNVVAAMTNNG